MFNLFSLKQFSQNMLRATRLTGIGKLLDATRLIQRTLGTAPQAWPKADNALQPAIIPPGPAQPGEDTPQNVVQETVRRKASFRKHRFTFEGATYPYRLYIPLAPASGSNEASPMPLVVLLHGCKQDALDFSKGTAMNALAETQQVMVLYPEQITSANALRCWNWFEPGHQQAERGEPGMIAALTRQIVQQHAADPQRVYIAGLSAGGAMAAVVSSLYPDIFAAVGVHSGLAAGAARDVMSAFGAMRSGAEGHALPVLPTIVFHGTADTTVHPDNGEHVTDAALAAHKAAGVHLVKTQSTQGKSAEENTAEENTGAEKTERVVYSTADGKSAVENWRIDAGPHAWSGGSSAGSYTDPDGPSASAAMLTFFLQHRLRPT